MCISSPLKYHKSIASIGDDDYDDDDQDDDGPAVFIDGSRESDERMVCRSYRIRF